MLVYSKKIIQFINDIKTNIKDVLAREIRFKVLGDRFTDRQERFSYPIKVVIFNHEKKLGYFNPQFYELGFHERLMHSTPEKLRDVIRHELAHYITFITYGDTVMPHGPEFKAFCQRMGWSDEVQKATTFLDDTDYLPSEENSRTLRKVQKLMALSSSSNKNEAEQAMVKSQQLLLKHNIDHRHIEEDNDEKFFLKRVMQQKKNNAKMQSIGIILETFFVSVVFKRVEECTYLEIVGSAVNVDIAEYVANILQDKLEQLWNQARKEQIGLKGTIAKNSFFIGVARGYCDKIQSLKKQCNSTTSTALMVIEKKLEEAQSMVYSRLRTSQSNAHFCPESSRLGEKAGSQLNINPAINNRAESAQTSLSYQS